MCPSTQTRVELITSLISQMHPTNPGKHDMQIQLWMQSGAQSLGRLSVKTGFLLLLCYLQQCSLNYQRGDSQFMQCLDHNSPLMLPLMSLWNTLSASLIVWTLLWVHSLFIDVLTQTLLLSLKLLLNQFHWQEKDSLLKGSSSAWLLHHPAEGPMRRPHRSHFSDMIGQWPFHTVVI